eukprot:13753860-Alexandrium_andersonii.AAC.1
MGVPAGGPGASRPPPHRLQLWNICLHKRRDLGQNRGRRWSAVQPPLGLGAPEDSPAELGRTCLLYTSPSPRD